MKPGFYQIRSHRMEIKKVVAEYKIDTLTTFDFFPFHYVSVQVLENSEGKFEATPNVGFRSPDLNASVPISVTGETIEKAVTEALDLLFGEAESRAAVKPLEYGDFCWFVFAVPAPWGLIECKET